MSASLTSAIPITTSSSSIPLDIAQITGPLLFGPLVNWSLYGVLCAQTYVYSYNFPGDKPIVKFLAYFTFLLETAQTALNGADVYFWFIEGFGNMERLKDSHFTGIDIPIFHGIIAFIVQGYFCYRIWTLKQRSSKLCIVIALLTILQSVGSTWGGIKSMINREYAVSRVALYLWSIPSVLADILIAIAMILILRKTRREAGRYTSFVMFRLVRLTIETNALTAMVALFSFILYVAFPNKIYYLFTTGIIGKIYSNTLLVSLNNRIYFRDHPGTEFYVDTDHLAESNHSRPSAIVSHHITPVGSQAHTATSGDDHELHAISHTIDLEQDSKGDIVSIKFGSKPLELNADLKSFLSR